MVTGQGEAKPSILKRIKTLAIGAARSPHDESVFHKLSLIAFFAWVGLGADGLSSSSYGPQEAFRAIGSHPHLALFVALATAATVVIISASYSQIIELFPTGGGGYLVASKLLSPNLGMISGCALLIDYVLTIAVSISSGADAVFSFLPVEFHSYKLILAVAGIGILTLMNLRGVRESVMPLVPIFIIFLITHAFAIVYGICMHATEIPDVVRATGADIQGATTELGVLGVLILILRSYSMGAGTYTGIEAVSNGMQVLREPRVRTGKRTMRYMAMSLALTVLGLMITYVLYTVHIEQGKTLNAVLFEHATADWPPRLAWTFVTVTLVSEAALLFVGAQTGFMGGPRVIATMALDRWFPTRFGTLSDRLVTQNGIILMGAAALLITLFTRGSVEVLVILYSINVFITFVLSQLGMVRHWWSVRATERRWRKRIIVNSLGLVTSAFILVSVTALKFREGGWVTLLITGSLIATAVLIRRHYTGAAQLLCRLEGLVTGAESLMRAQTAKSADGAPEPKLDPKAKTAVIFVSGFNGLGLHSFFSIVRLFGGTFKNFAFIEVGLVDAGNFKGTQEVQHLNDFIRGQVDKYVQFVKMNGYYGEAFFSVGVDIVDEMTRVTPKILERFPDAVFFGGQIVFPEDSLWSRWLHNYVVFAVQRKLYRQGVPFVILPVRL